MNTYATNNCLQHIFVNVNLETKTKNGYWDALYVLYVMYIVCIVCDNFVYIFLNNSTPFH